MVALIQSFQRSYDNYTILKGTLDPPEPYQIHRVQLQLPVKDEVSTANSSDAVYFAVKTVDDGGNEAEISNVVLVQFMLLPQLRNEPSTFFNKYAMTGIGIGSGLCILGLVVFLSCFVRKLRREDKKKDDEKKDGFNFTEFTNY